MLADLADATGPVCSDERALPPFRQRDRGYGPGWVAVDLAVIHNCRSATGVGRSIATPQIATARRVRPGDTSGLVVHSRVLGGTAGQLRQYVERAAQLIKAR